MRAFPILVCVAAFANAACTPPTASERRHDTSPGTAPAAIVSSGALSAMPDWPEVIDEVQLDGAGSESFAARASDVEMERALDNVERLGFVGLKPADAGNTAGTGVVPRITRRELVDAADELAAMGAEVVQRFRNSPMVVARIPKGAVAGLRKSAHVNFVEPVAGMRLGAQTTPWGVAKVRAPVVWGLGYQGQGVFVTILDSGVDGLHAFDPAGDGPANLPVFNCMYVYTTSPNGGQPDQHCFDGGIGHGSNIAGIVAAINNGAGVVGVSPSPSAFASIKVCYPGNGLCWSNAVVAGLDWTTTSANGGRRPQVVNMSFFVDNVEGAGNQANLLALQDAIVRSYNAGNILVAGVGNGGVSSTHYPAAFSQVIAVSGTTDVDGFAQGNPCASDFGPHVDVSAPIQAYSLGISGSYQTLCGTSMATAHVTGVLALLWGRYPLWSSSQVRARLEQSAVDLGPSGRDNQFGFGRVDAVRALFTPTVVITGPTTRSVGQVGTWMASVSQSPGPYSYSWTVNGVAYGSGPTLTTSFSSSGPRTIRVDVADVPLGTQAFGILSVSVGCLFSC